VSVIGLLALPGSQSMAPGAVAFLNSAHGGESSGGQSFHYDPMWPGAPGDGRIQALDAAPAANGPKPYGLTSPAGLTASGIPEPADRAYVNAATSLARTDPSCKINWSLIAGIGRVESNHGRFGGSTIGSDGLVTPPILGIRLDGSRPGTARISDSDGGRYDGDPVFDRAVGPMQFLPGTWRVYGGGANPQNMNAAALAAGRYLCAGGGALDTQQGRWAAVYRYNHSDSYVSLVLSLADSYASGHVVTFPARPAGTPPPDNGPSATTPGPPPAVPTPPATTPTTPPTTPPTGTPTTQPTATPTGSPTGSPTPTPTPTGTGTSTPTDTGTPSPTPSDTPTPTPSDTPTPTATSTPADTSTPTDTASPSDSPTSGSATPSCSATPTSTPTPTDTPTPSGSPCSG
jgi:hypothetical protein